MASHIPRRSLSREDLGRLFCFDIGDMADYDMHRCPCVTQLQELELRGTLLKVRLHSNLSSTSALKGFPWAG